MTIFDEARAGAAELRRQIKISGGLKMGEAGCTGNTGEAHDTSHRTEAERRDATIRLKRIERIQRSFFSA